MRVPEKIEFRHLFSNEHDSFGEEKASSFLSNKERKELSKPLQLQWTESNCSSLSSTFEKIYC